jgi:hypothetical protein
MGVPTTYITDTPEACFCERSFYRLIEYVTKFDNYQANTQTNSYIFKPKEQKEYVIWEIKFRDQIDRVFDLTQSPKAVYSYGIIPSLMKSPTQDYWHLKTVRAIIQRDGYNGIKVASCRGDNVGNIIVLFGDQSVNVSEIVPNLFVISIIEDTNTGVCNLFNDCSNQKLDFTACQVNLIAPYQHVTTHLSQYRNPQKVIFKR